MKEIISNNKAKFIAIGIIILLLAAVSFYGQKVTKEELDNFIKENRLENVVHYESISFNPLTMTPSIEQVRINDGNGQVLSFEKFVIHSHDIDKRKGNINVDISYVLEPMPLNEAPKEFKKMLLVPAMYGLSTFGGEGRLAVNTDNGEASINLNLDTAEVVGLNAELSAMYDETMVNKFIDSVRQYGFFALLGLNDTLLRATSLNEFNLSLESERYLKKIITDYEQQADESEDRQVAELTRAVEQMGLAQAGTDEMEDITSELMDFISSPGKLSISASPDETISIQNIMKFLQQRAAFRGLNMDISG